VCPGYGIRGIYVGGTHDRVRPAPGTYRLRISYRAPGNPSGRQGAWLTVASNEFMINEMKKKQENFLRSTYPECTRNLFDTTRFYNYFRKNGFQLVRNPSCADVVVLTTCGFDRNKEDRTMRLIGIMTQRIRKKIVICGCLLQRDTAWAGHSSGH
jgi:hypothetical protein